MRDIGADDGSAAPTIVPAPMRAPRMHVAPSDRRTPAPGSTASSSSASATSCVANVRRRLRLRQPRPRAAERDLEPQPIAGHDLPAELGVVDAAQRRRARSAARRRARGRAPTPPASAPRSSAPPGISGVPGKCPWKNSSLTVTFLNADEPGARLVLPDRVDQERRITVIDAIEERGKVDGHW